MNMPCICCLTLCYRRSSLADKLQRSCISFPAVQNILRDKSHSSSTIKCLFCSFPLPLWVQAGLSSFWNFPHFSIFALKKMAELCRAPVPTVCCSGAEQCHSNTAAPRCNPALKDVKRKSVGHGTSHGLHGCLTTRHDGGL